MTNSNLDTILEIVKIVAPLGLWACVAIVLAMQSPKLLREFLTFVRGVIKDWRSKPKVEKSPTPQISKPHSG
jgi:hypothetical protein